MVYYALVKRNNAPDWAVILSKQKAKYMKQRKWDAKLLNLQTIMKTVELTKYIGPTWWYNPLTKEE